MHSYLSLLSLSQKDATLEASCGVLQNLTAGKDVVSDSNITEIEGKGRISLFSLFIVFGFVTEGIQRHVPDFGSKVGGSGSHFTSCKVS